MRDRTVACHTCIFAEKTHLRPYKNKGKWYQFRFCTIDKTVRRITCVCILHQFVQGKMD